jgi:hypothetical protein
MKRIITILYIAFLLSHNAYSQKHQFGVSLGLYDYYYFGDGIVGNWLLEANTSVVRGKTVELNYKLNYKHFYFEPQLTFCYNIGSISLTNVELDRSYEGRHIYRIMGGLNEMHFGLSSIVGLQTAFKGFNFRGYLGITPSYLVKESSIDVYVAPWDEINRCIYRSYKPFVLYGSWGFGIDYWRFSIDLKRENNLTPLIGNINYEGGTYEFNYETKRLFLILGFNFYPWKIKDYSPKPPI